jgi:hypothetical protein
MTCFGGYIRRRPLVFGSHNGLQGTCWNLSHVRQRYWLYLRLAVLSLRQSSLCM